MTTLRVMLQAAGPPSGDYPFVFTDEAGVAAFSPTEPYFGVGMLKIADAGPWNDDLNRLLDVFIAQNSGRGRRTPRGRFELKFSAVTIGTRPLYERFIDYFVGRSDGCFSALVVDKRAAREEFVGKLGGSWGSLIAYSTALLRTALGTDRPDERAIIVADNYQKPKRHARYFERELVRALVPYAANVMMADSCASSFLQLVDILLGAVLYHHKLPILPRVDAEKKALADRVALAYGVPTLARTMSCTLPNRFSVRRFPFVPEAPETESPDRLVDAVNTGRGSSRI
jgi:hypothetical protein